MKKILLATSVLLSASVFAQFTQATEPAIGATKTYFRLVDSSPEYASATGASAMWDYSGTSGQGISSTRDISIVDPASTTQAADFTSSTKAYNLGDYIITYTTSSASSRNSQGFYFDDGTTQITGKYTADDEILMSYPLVYGNSGMDNFSGTVSALGQNIPATGNISYTFDGTGMLMLSSTVTINNAMRYKAVDQVTGTTPFGNATMTRTQYEYYDPSSSDHLPVFIWSKIEIALIGGSPTTTISVLNSVQPDSFLGVDENALPNVSIYPNPAKENLFVAGLENDADLTIVNVSGQTVKTVKASAGTTSIAVSDLKAGVYMVTVTSEKGTKTERIVLQ